MNTLRVRMKPYIQPFERVLAIQELQAVGGPDLRHLGLFEETSIDFELSSPRTQSDLAGRLAYWETVEHETHRVVTEQSLREWTVNLVRNGVALSTLRKQLSFKDEILLPNRRCLRYGTHGIHEYRGKFFPQLVRSLINISGAQPGCVVGDPMIGSGTTAVEALLAGCQGFGMDMNPLSVFLGRVKCKLLSADAEQLATSYEQIRTELLQAKKNNGKQLDYFESLPRADQEYLSAWFSQDVLAGLDDIIRAVAEIPYDHAQDLMRASLSNIMRSVSWQKNSDLRVRKEIRLDAEIGPKKKFLDELERSIRAVLALLYQNGPIADVSYDIVEGDAKRCDETWGESVVDVIISSPPYATALPYLDTDRLSLCYLGLLPRPGHRARDQLMIGNREVSEGLRRAYWTRFEEDGQMLPAAVRDLIRHIASLNAPGNVGFRRRNLPALLAKYFFDMREVIGGMYRALKPGSMAFVIVGNNHTIAGGCRVEIQTASLLRDIASSAGFEVADSLSMDMLVSRDIFRTNAISSEEILSFRRPG